MSRIFDNPNVLPREIVALRFNLSADSPDIFLYSVKNEDTLVITQYLSIESSLTDGEIISLLSQVISADEFNFLNKKSSSKTEAALANGLKELTVAEAMTYIDNNVTSIATLKPVLKLMVRILLALLHDRWPNL